MVHSSPINVIELDWHDVRTTSSLPPSLNSSVFDIILCADLIYELTYEDLAYTLLLIFRQSPSAKVLMANAARKHVHLFRKKLLGVCEFKIIDDSCVESNAQIVWLVCLQENPDWTVLSLLNS
mmetsp:Transcript_7769/g.11546  ORF Transcript_7769/g.11546 Transcript_7769/m.11546 type:complete len:123 (-) Transcript_7769:141-509(-)